MKLILVRHGESEANFQNYWTGWLDVDLTEKGIQQARDAGNKIKQAGLTIDLAYESVFCKKQAHILFLNIKLGD